MGTNTIDVNTNAVATAMDGLRIVVGAISSASRLSEQRLGVTGAQLFVLQTLREGGELSVNVLAERTHTHQSTVSTVVTKLVQKGLVHRKRSDLDARVQLLSLTTLGRQKLRRSAETVQDRLIRAISALPESEGQQFAATFRTILECAGLSGQTPNLFLEPKNSAGKMGRTNGTR